MFILSSTTTSIPSMIYASLVYSNSISGKHGVEVIDSKSRNKLHLLLLDVNSMTFPGDIRGDEKPSQPFLSHGMTETMHVVD